MEKEIAAVPIPQVTFWDKFSFYGGMAVKAFIFFIVLGFLTVYLWKPYYDNTNFWNYPLVGLVITWGIIITLLLLGVVTATFSKIFSIFKPKNN